MDLNFERFAVIWTYFQYRGSVPTPAHLRQWDEQLKDDYDNILVERLEEYGLPTDIQTKSHVLMLAKIAPAVSLPAQVRRACEYYASAWPEAV